MNKDTRNLTDTDTNDTTDTTTDDNRDPLTGTPGSHMVGTGLGAVAGGAAAGAAAASVAGPVGTVAGAAVGAVVGGLAGKGIAEAINPTAEDAYWRQNYADRDYVEQGSTYDDYGPAYGYGVNAYGKYRGRRFEDVESELSADWDNMRGVSRLGWGRAKHAVHDAWNRVRTAF
ncbi:MAG: hypothetical protein ORN29_08485 [Rhodoferax sp.]|nr:hypothetical protein [Rhodoferax sp.]